MSCCVSATCAARSAGAQRGASKLGGKAVGCVGGMCAGFRDFILRGNVVDLAVAIVVGSSFTALVNALVADWLTPFIAIIFKPEEVFGDLTFTLHGSVFKYGHFLNVFFTFMLVCTILYFLVVLPINSLFKLVYPPKKTRECPECCADIPVRARRCKFCCAAVEPAMAEGLTSKKVTEDDGEVFTRSKTAPASLPGAPRSPAPAAAALSPRAVTVRADAKSASMPAVCNQV